MSEDMMTKSLPRIIFTSIIVYLIFVQNFYILLHKKGNGNLASRPIFFYNTRIPLSTEVTMYYI